MSNHLAGGILAARDANAAAPSGTLRVLNLEDNPNDSELIQAELQAQWERLEWLRVETREAFERALEEFKPDIVLSDFNLAGFDGRAALGFVRKRHPEIPVVMVTGALHDVDAAELVRMGARDYVMKDHLPRLNSAVRQALSVERGIRARKQAENALRESEQELRALVEHSPVAMLVNEAAGADAKVALMNRRFTELFGYTMEDVPDLRRWRQLACPDARCRAMFEAKRQEQGAPGRAGIQPQDVTLTCKDGSLRQVRISAASIGARSIVTFEDMTEHERAAARIQRLNQLYAALSHCNQAIVRSRSENELFADICRIAVVFGGFKMAWIGLSDPETRRVDPVASYGEGADDYLRGMQIPTDAGGESGQGAAGIAIRENHAVWNQDFQHAPLASPWREQAAARGWRGSASLPLRREGEAVGVFVLYSDATDSFDEAAWDLLTEMSNDISYALDNLKHEAGRKSAEESLRKLSQAVEQSPNSIVITNLGAVIEYVNEGFVQTTGYSRAEAVGRNPRMLQSGKTPRATYRDMWAHLTRGEAWRGEFTNRRKNGNEYVETVFISPVCAADGRVTHYLGIKEDSTERKRAEQALQESEEKFRVMSESAQDAIIMMDEEGNISFWNSAAEKIFGYPAPEAMGRNLHRLLAPQRYHEDYDKGFAHFLLSGEGEVVGRTQELLGLRRDGREFPVELSLNAVEIGGKRHAVGILRDITERKQVEAQVVEQYQYVAGINTQLLETNRQLELARNQLLQSEKMAAIGLLAAGVAHEINNPVGYVNSNLGTLERYLASIFAILDRYESAEALMAGDAGAMGEIGELKARLDLAHIREDIKSLLAESHQGLERVKKIVLDLKDFSHTDPEDKWVWADVHHSLDSTLNVVWNELKYKCEVVKEYGELPQIYCLPSQLNQVFMNLLVNASQAIEVRGRITIRTGREDDMVWVEVSDTGKGIPPENLPRLFDPFFTTKPVGKGTGLGLSVSYKIVEKHHGRIDVHSEAGVGSAFRVWLPVQGQERPERSV